MLLPDAPRRGLVYAYHDAGGILDAANARYLAALLEHVSTAVVVANGELDERSQQRVRDLGARIVVRGNEGYDIWAYKRGIEELGDEVDELDELVIANSSVLGPVRALGDTFDAMAGRDVDFWGMTRHAGKAFAEHPSASRSERSHVQSYFTVVRSSVLRGDEFRGYWHRLPRILGHSDAVQLHELEFTGYLEDAGFTWDVAVDTSDLEATSENPVIAHAALLVEERGCPVFKRRMLNLGMGGLLAHSDGTASRDLRAAVERLAPEVMEDALEHALRTMEPVEVRRALQRTVWVDEATAPATGSTFVVVAAGPFAREAAERWSHLVGASNVAIVTGRKQLDAARAAAAASGAALVEAGKTPLIVAAAQAAGDADAVLLVGDVTRKALAEDARVAREHARRSLGWDATSIDAVHAAFAQSPRLGALLPPPSLARRLYGSVLSGDEELAALASSMVSPGVSDVHDVHPGASAWVRGSMLRAIAPAIAASAAEAPRRIGDHGWLAIALTIAARHGYGVGTAMTRASAGSQVAVAMAAIGDLNAALGVQGEVALDAVVRDARAEGLDATVFFDTGSGYRHTTSRRFQLEAGAAEIAFTIPAGTVGVRIDPAEATGLVATTPTVVPSGYRMIAANGTRTRGIDFFSWPDPVYELVGPLRAGDEVTVRFEHLERVRGSVEGLALVEGRLGAPSTIRRARAFLGRGVRKGLRVARTRTRSRNAPPTGTDAD